MRYGRRRMEQTYCKCGCRKSRQESLCTSCIDKRDLVNAYRYVQIEDRATCPDCGRELVAHHFVSLYWLQCRGFGQNRQVGDKPCSYDIVGVKRAVDGLKLMSEGLRHEAYLMALERLGEDDEIEQGELIWPSQGQIEE